MLFLRHEIDRFFVVSNADQGRNDLRFSKVCAIISIIYLNYLRRERDLGPRVIDNAVACSQKLLRYLY